MSSPVEQWTEARYWGFIRSALRRAWSKYPNKYKVLNAARRRKLHAKGNQKWEYKCAECLHYLANKNVVVDHIHPAGTVLCYNDLPAFVSRLFCGVKGLQVLCRRCHQKKTNAERGLIPEVTAFKKLKAKEQYEELRRLGLAEGKNGKERVQTIEAHYEASREVG